MKPSRKPPGFRPARQDEDNRVRKWLYHHPDRAQPMLDLLERLPDLDLSPPSSGPRSRKSGT